MALSSERLATRRLHLVQVAQALIRERGDAGFSMALLAQRAGVSAATPYNLLGSKATIIREVVREDIAQFVRELEGHSGATPLASLLAAADLLVDHYERDRALHQGLFHAAFGGHAPEVRNVLSSESWAWWGDLVRAAIASGELAAFVRPGHLTDVLLRTMGAVAQTWLAESWPRDRFAFEMSASVRLLLAAVSAPSLRDAMIREITALQAQIERATSARSRTVSDT